MLKTKGKNVEKPLIKEPIRYIPKKSKQDIPINDKVKEIKNIEYVDVIVNVDDVDLNKEGNYTLKNETEN